MKASKLIKKFFFPLLITILAGYLAVVNYEPGTILAGWDSLHPEFNFPLAFKRAIFGVWREDQGLGAVAIHSHMAELPRLALLWVSSLVLNTPDIRYFYVFLTLILGPLGVYSFLSGSFRSKLASFLGSAFYLLNLTTLQHFFVPFEMFLTQYALLPWLFMFVIKVLEKGRKKDILIFFLLSFLAAPMAYAATLFYAYLGALVIFLLVYTIISPKRIETAKRGFFVLILLFASNAFWMLPNLYAVKNTSGVVAESRINTLFSPEAFLRNKDYGSIEDISLQRSYLFSWRAYDFESGGYEDLFLVWKDHLKNKWVLYTGYALAAISFLGVIFGLLKRNKIAISFLFVLIYSLFFLLNSNPPAGEIYSYLYENFPMFSEGFRMPFSKFSIIYIFSLSFFFGYFYNLIFRGLRSKLLKVIVALVTMASLIFFMKPAFTGSLISDVVKTNIPEEYSQAFNYLNEREGRVAKLPVYTQFNWEYHDWKYEGSAWFSWFSMQNPQLDRDFDRFSKFNESFYNQASFALYSKDLSSFEAVLEKHNVSYLLLDESVINAGGSKDLLYIDELRQMLTQSNNIRMVQKYGFLEVYETDFGKSEAMFAPSAYDKVDADLVYAQIDPVYEEKGRYTAEDEGVTYPFVNFDTRQRPSFEFTGSEIVFETDSLNFSSVKFLAMGDLINEHFGTPEVEINEKKALEARIPVSGIVKEDFRDKRGFDEAKNCDIKELGSVYKDNTGDKVVYRAEDGGVSCDFFVYKDLAYSQGYILHVKGENRKGRRLKIYLQNRETGRMDLEQLLPKGKFDEYYFVLPKPVDGEGYTLNLETRSFGDIASENVLEEVSFIPFPYEWLTNIKLVPQSYAVQENRVSIVSQEKLNPERYELRVAGGEDGGLIVLDQAYEKGWKAYLVNGSFFEKALPFVFAEEIEHTKVNSWANGWYAPSGDSELLIVFAPQYLEYLGIVILGIAILALITSNKPEVDFKGK